MNFTSDIIKKKSFTLAAISILVIAAIFLFTDKTEIKQPEKPFQQNLSLSDERILRLDQNMFFEEETDTISVIKKMPGLDTDINSLSLLNEPEADILNLYKNYVQLMSDPVHELYYSTDSPNYHKAFLLEESKKNNSGKFYLGDSLYLSDHLGYLHNKRWVFELEINDLFFWAEERNTEKIFSSENSDREESTIVTFSLKYSF
ncbi:MAG: hypothetical protein NE328_06375 [Lentisphaeraceae bacterium]|nr:hypothetical protein [Lentisphaeraceae bacterium]